MAILFRPAPELITSSWINTANPICLKALTGKVVVIHAFQMLCPGCVSHAIPQMQKVNQLFSANDVMTIGLHSVFEHHDVMNEAALKAFVHEYKLTFPIAVDQASEGRVIPQTMSLYEMQGTPTTIIVDKQGVLRLNYFGRIDDLLLGKTIGQLMAEGDRESSDELIWNGVNTHTTPYEKSSCDDSSCKR